MGHIRLGTLPKTHKWQRVVGLIAGGADVERIAAASADAAEHGLERASQDQGLAHAFWLLTQIPQAARQSDFADQLKRLGLEVSSKPTLLEIVGAFTSAVDRHVRENGKRSESSLSPDRRNARPAPLRFVMTDVRISRSSGG